MDIIMQISGIIMMLLFLVILFLTGTIIASFFIYDKKYSFSPKLSIVIPCFNEEKNIGACLNSIKKSSYPKDKLEIIVVDDGSTDRTVTIIKAFDVRLIRSRHIGKSDALNLGVKKAKYDFVLTLDADTEIDKHFIKNIVKPFQDPNVGATNGACLAKNHNNILETFQRIEYFWHSTVRKAFTKAYSNGLWFFGAFSCYRKSVLKDIGYFKKDTMAEDMDIFLEIYERGHKILNVPDAIGFTVVPSTIKSFIRQRARWSYGGLQALKKSIRLFRIDANPSILFLFINQWWWTFYAGISFFIIGYQFMYWLPGSIPEILSYSFRWFSAVGPFYVIYKIPEWGISFYSIFGVLCGILNLIVLLGAMHIFKERLTLKNAIALFFYFPYTILINFSALISLFKWFNIKKSFFFYEK